MSTIYICQFVFYQATIANAKARRSRSCDAESDSRTGGRLFLFANLRIRNDIFDTYLSVTIAVLHERVGGKQIYIYLYTVYVQKT
jgi:hypothetical protein